MSDTVDIVICSGYSPGARVLRAAVRDISKRRPIRVVTVAPALAQLPKAMDDMKSLKDRKVIVVDGCDGLCGLQVLMQFGVEPKGKIMMGPYFKVDEKGIADTVNLIEKKMNEVLK
jgi:uncharacterized metal-binding protein